MSTHFDHSCSSCVTLDQTSNNIENERNLISYCLKSYFCLKHIVIVRNCMFAKCTLAKAVVFLPWNSLEFLSFAAASCLKFPFNFDFIFKLVWELDQPKSQTVLLPNNMASLGKLYEGDYFLLYFILLNVTL